MSLSTTTSDRDRTTDVFPCRVRSYHRDAGSRQPDRRRDVQVALPVSSSLSNLNDRLVTQLGASICRSGWSGATDRFGAVLLRGFWSARVRPALHVHDPGDVRLGYAELVCERLHACAVVGVVSLADSSDLSVREFGTAVCSARSGRLEAGVMSVLHVPAGVGPLQVLDPVVVLDSVQVIHAREATRSRSDECFDHQSVNLVGSSESWSAEQADRDVSTGPRFGAEARSDVRPSGRRGSPDVALVTDFVDPFVSGARLPFFRHCCKSISRFGLLPDFSRDTVSARAA